MNRVCRGDDLDAASILYFRLRKYLNAERAMSDPSSIQPSEGGTIEQHDLTRLNLDCRGCFQMGERAGNCLKGQAEIFSNVSARHRQLDCVACGSWSGDLQQE